MLLNTFKNEPRVKSIKEKKRIFKPSVTLEEKGRSVSHITNDLKFSQKVDLNSSIFKASYLANPIYEDGNLPSMKTSSKVSSNLSSEISREEQQTPENSKDPM